MKQAEAAKSLANKEQAARFLSFTKRTLENHMRAGRIPYIKIGRTVRFNLDDLAAHLNTNCRVN